MSRLSAANLKAAAKVGYIKPTNSGDDSSAQIICGNKLDESLTDRSHQKPKWQLHAENSRLSEFGSVDHTPVGGRMQRALSWVETSHAGSVVQAVTGTVSRMSAAVADLSRSTLRAAGKAVTLLTASTVELQRTIAEASGLELTAISRQSRLMVRVAFVGVVLRDILCCCIMVSFLFMVK